MLFERRLLRGPKQLLRRLASGSARPKSSYLHSPGEHPLRYKTMGRLLDEAAAAFGDRTAFVSRHQNQRITFAQAKEKAEELASGLLELGVNRGDRVGLWAPNSAEWYLLNFALAKCGGISVYINPAYQADEVTHCLNKVGVKMLIVGDKFKTQDYYGIVSDIAPEVTSSLPGNLKCEKVPTLESLVVLAEEAKPGSYTFRDICKSSTKASRIRLKECEDAIEPEDACNIQFTSGTTGNPKGAVLSHFAVVNNSYFISHGQEFHAKETRLCFLGPFFHAMGSVVAVLTCLHHGATLVIPDFGFNAEKAVDTLLREKCTAALGTPTMFVDIFRVLKEKDVKLDVEVAFSGGSLCPPQLYKDMKSLMGVKRVGWIYGLTESGPVAFMITPGISSESNMTTVGRLLPHAEAKVVDAEGATLPCDTPGELWLRGFLLMSGYWGDEEKTRESVTSRGWLRTGDQFVIQENGFGRIIGRVKDIIIRGGENIYPADVEEFLCSHPEVAEVQVLGVPDERLGEQVCACLVTSEADSKMTEEDVKGYCKGKIAHFKIPHYVFFFDEFPRTASGKIQKYRLKEMVASLIEKRK